MLLQPIRQVPIPNSNLRLLVEMGGLLSSHVRRRFGSTAQMEKPALSETARRSAEAAVDAFIAVLLGLALLWWGHKGK